MTLTLVDLIDHIAADLQPIADLIAPDGYLDWRYTRPDMLTADHAPWLAIYPPDTTHTLLDTTGDYQDDHTITIEWAISIAAAIETGGDPNLARQAITDAATITDQLRTYTEGLPGISNQIVATLTTTTRDTTEGLVWKQTTHLTINDLGAQ